MLTSRVVTANRAAGLAPARTPPRARRAAPTTRVGAAADPPRAPAPTTASAIPATEATTPPARPSVAGPMPIVWISTEVAGWASTGGLGQVSAELPRELARRGHRVMTIAPRWDQYADAWDTAVSADVGGETVRFFQTKRSGADHVWVDSPIFLERVWGKTGSKLYGPTSGTDYPDSHAAFALFCRAALAAIDSLPFSPASGAPGARQPFAIVANDWHAALVPVLIKDVEVPAGRFTNARTVLVTHNASFQGRAPASYFSATGLPQSSFDRFAFEDGDPRAPGGPDPGPTPPGARFAKINWLKAGASAADRVVTVSPAYAAELTSGPKGGVELDATFLAAGVEGIANGLDTAVWSPSTSPHIAQRYDASSVASGKAAAKAALQAELGLAVDPAVPLVGVVSRLEEQKGVDLLLAAAPALAAAGVQLAILGTGKPALEAGLEALTSAYPGAAAGVVRFDTPLAHRIFAGADIVAVPSRFEPCGIVQMQALSFGAGAGGRVGWWPRRHRQGGNNGVSRRQIRIR